MNRFIYLVAIICLAGRIASGQNGGSLSGSLESTTHYYLPDSRLQIPEPGNPVASNNYMRIQYLNGPFSAAAQYEAYMPPLSGYPYQLEGNRIAFLNFGYSNRLVEVTAGSFYEQFGSGLTLRAYESRELGINNALNGVRVIFKPMDYLSIKGIIGKPRRYMELSDSYIRGIDAELEIGELLDSKAELGIGGGVTGRYEQYTGPAEDFPENVNAWNARLSGGYGDFSFNTEYVFKSSDPTVINLYSTESGGSLMANATYSSGGLGIFGSVRFLKAMDFRSERESEGNYTMINYLPANTWQHTFLLGSIYPYNTQPQGEASFQADINYSAEKETFAGGKHGARFRLGFSHIRSLKSGSDDLPVLVSFGDEVYYQDITLEMDRRWSGSFKTLTSVTALQYNKDVVEFPGGGFIRAVIANFESQARLSGRLSLRTELQHLWTKQDAGNWIAALAELGWSPNISLFISDMWDYQNETSSAHYYNSGVTFSHEYMRVSAGYGRYREGQICAGGICQRVPAYRGFNLRITVSF